MPKPSILLTEEMDRNQVVVLRQNQNRALIADRLDEYGRYRPAAFGENFYAFANGALIRALARPRCFM
jgi:hypothetical protein